MIIGNIRFKKHFTTLARLLLFLARVYTVNRLCNVCVRKDLISFQYYFRALYRLCQGTT
jgi:hypothetical protein